MENTIQVLVETNVEDIISLVIKDFEFNEVCAKI
jgi:hypothetical protein